MRLVGLPSVLAAALAAGCYEPNDAARSANTNDPASGFTTSLIAGQACANPSEPESLTRDMIDAINSERAKRELKPLRQNGTLMQIADFYACRLVDGHFFDHYDPYDGSTVVERAIDFGYPFFQIGENLAARQATVKEAMIALMNSPKHRANILDPVFTEIGVAVKIGGDHGVYWVQEFGRPLSEESTSSPDSQTAGYSETSTAHATDTPATPKTPALGTDPTAAPTSQSVE
ncbi:MAG: CAP domain-containing protein [Phycisphaerae bacterium]|nr:CAP domain-containing protein [Phycisphaerae bacterium]